VHLARRDHLSDRGAPHRPQQVRAPLHLIGEGRDREVDAQAAKTIALAMQRQAVEILVDEDRRDEPEPELTLGNDRLTGRCTHRRSLARHARELLADVAPHDHLGRQQLDDFGDVRRNAGALGAALRARALAGGDADRVVDAAQVVRCRRPRRRLSPRTSRAQLG
jgi:hypothetical protein